MSWFFDASAFVTRDCCGVWEPWLKAIYQGSSAVTAICYFLIPLFLIYVWRTRKNILPEPRILLWFAAFILLCGLTHVADSLSFVWPAYRLFAMLEFATAIASVRTLIALPGVVRKLLQLKSPAEYEHQLRGRQHALQLKVELQKKLIEEREKLLVRVADMELLLEEAREVIKNREITDKLLEKLHAITDGR